MSNAYRTVISDIHHLRRVHLLLKDAGLAAILTSKLTRLNLQPALREAQAQQQLGALQPSFTVVSAHSAAPPSTNTNRILYDNPLLLSPSSLVQLLECLAYFQLGDSPVSEQAVALTQLCIPLLPPPLLARAVGACAAMGESGTTVHALPLLLAALGTSKEGTVLLPGPLVLLLVSGMADCGVRQEELWRSVVEHCHSVLDTLEGHHLVRLVTLLHDQQGVIPRDCAESLYSAIQQHVLQTQRKTEGLYLTRTQLEELFQYLQLLGQPVVELQALLQRGSSPVDVLEQFRPGTEDNTNHNNTNAIRHYMPATNDPEFIRCSVEFLGTANAADLQSWLERCHERRLMHQDVMSAAVARWFVIYFAPNGEKNIHDQPLESTPMLATLRLLLKFRNKSFFSRDSQAQVVLALCGDQHTKPFRIPFKTSIQRMNVIVDSLLELFDREFQPFHNNKNKNVTLEPFYRQFIEFVKQSKEVSVLLGSMASDANLPAPVPNSKTSSANNNTNQNQHPNRGQTTAFLLTFTSNLVRLRTLGGAALLKEHVPSITAAGVHCHRRAVQLELLYVLSELPRINQLPVLSALLRAVKEGGTPPTTQRRGTGGLTLQWTVSLTTADLRHVLLGMLRAKVIDKEVLQGVTQLLKEQPHRVAHPQDLAQFAYYLSLLGVREVEVYVSITNSLLAATRSTRDPTTVHDLALLLLTFTSVLRGVIRVVQEVFSRIKVGGGRDRATPTDIQYILVSMVRLSVQNNNTDITLPLCQRAAAVLGDFTGKILSNVWVSLRLLRCLPLPFAELTCQQVLEPWEVHHTSQKSVVKLTTPEFLMITSSVMELYAREEARQSVSGLYGRKKKETDDPASKKNDFVAWYGSPLLQHKYKEAVFQLLPKPSKDVKEANLNGIVLYWGIQTLKRFCLAKDSSVSLSQRECGLLLWWADVYASQLNTYHDNKTDHTSDKDPKNSQIHHGYSKPPGIPQAEVLLALYDFYQAAMQQMNNDTTKKETDYPNPAMATWDSILMEECGTDNTFFPLPPNLVNSIRDNIIAIQANNLLREELLKRKLHTYITRNAAPHPRDLSNPVAMEGGRRSGRPKQTRTPKKKEPSEAHIALDKFEKELKADYEKNSKRTKPQVVSSAEEVSAFDRVMEFTLEEEDLTAVKKPDGKGNAPPTINKAAKQKIKKMQTKMQKKKTKAPSNDTPAEGGTFSF